MYFFFGDGRFGNQLFQYLAIKKIKNDTEKIYTTHFNDLLHVFDNIQDVINIRGEIKIFFFIKLIKPFLEFLSKIRLINSYSQQVSLKNGKYFPCLDLKKKNGLISLNYVFPMYAQSESFFLKKHVHNLKIRSVHIRAAKNFMRNVPQHYQKIFVHVRRADYIDFKVLGNKSPILPLGYYLKQIKFLSKNVENPFFIFITDDVDYVKKNFFMINNKIISENTYPIDFSIMTLCNFGILANSSFSWWGGFFIENKKILLSPKYWLGWRKRIEFPPGISPSFATSVNI